eukprot:c863_g1_i1 orf=110-526(+)
MARFSHFDSATLLCLQRAIEFLLTIDVESLFTVPVTQKEVLFAKKWFVKNAYQGKSKHINPHAVAVLIILYLEELDGCVFTFSLRQYFMTAAGMATSHNIGILLRAKHHVRDWLAQNRLVPKFSLVRNRFSPSDCAMI